MKKSTALLILCAAACGLSSLAAESNAGKLPAASTQKGVTFAKDISPIFQASCVRCHSGDRPKAGLRLDTLENVLKGSKDGKIVNAGHSEDSQVVIAVARIDPEKAMPPMRRGRGGGRPGGPGGPPPGASGAPPGAPSAPPGGQPGQPGAGGPQGGPPPPKPLTPEQVGLVRAWIDQGAK